MTTLRRFPKRHSAIIYAVRTNDEELIRSCRAGDARAWEKVVNRYERLVFSIPLSYGLSRDDAADVAQLTFTILFQSLDRLQDDSRLGPWLATVARRHAWRSMERNRREGPARREDLAGSATLPGGAVLVGGDGGADPLEHYEVVEWLDRGLSTLDERCRALLLALYLAPEKLSYAETADRLGIPVGSIGPTRARCLKSLRRAMTEG